MKLSLAALIVEHEERHPNREWTLSQRRGRYRAASSPIGHVAVVHAANPEVMTAEAERPEDALRRVLQYLDAKARRAKQEGTKPPAA